MQRIVVAAKAGADEPWLADAAASLAEQTGAAVSVVSVDGLDVEMGSTMPRSEYEQLAKSSADAVGARILEAGREVDTHTRPGKVVPGVLMFAEEHQAPDPRRRVQARAGRQAPARRRLARARTALAAARDGHRAAARCLTRS